MDLIEQIIQTVKFYVDGFGIPVGEQVIPLKVIALLGAGFFLTVRLGFVQLRYLSHGFAVATGRYDDPNEPGDVSHFQALTTALSATVGIGNIAGAAWAIHYGGPGALFWMWMTALLGAATKFSEVTLAQRYREVTAETHKHEGTVAGGPMYYIEHGLGPQWRWMAIFFAIALGFTAFITGNAVQANTLADTMQSNFGTPNVVTGLLAAAVVAVVILGGITRIGRVTAVLAPLMAGIYVVSAMIIILMNAGAVFPTFALIIREAFSPSAGVAGTGIGILLVTLNWGVNRGLFSNEAGQGSAPIAHAAAKTDEPVSEGVVGLVEPFIDTIVIVTMTCLVLIITGVYDDRVPSEITLGGGDLTYVTPQPDGGLVEGVAPATIRITGGRQPITDGQAAFAWHDVPIEQFFTDVAQTQAFTGAIDPAAGHAIGTDGTTYDTLYGDAPEGGAPLTQLGFQRGLAPLVDWGGFIVVLSVILFAISTAISWSYYGDRCAAYLFGKQAVLPYRLVYVAMVFLGTMIAPAAVWDLGDIALTVCILPNLLALVLLSSKTRTLMDDYFARQAWLQQPKN